MQPWQNIITLDIIGFYNGIKHFILKKNRFILTAAFKSLLPVFCCTKIALVDIVYFQNSDMNENDSSN
jgi:hypothetical protein